MLHHRAQNLRLAAVVASLVPIVAGAQTLPSIPSSASALAMLVDRGPTFYAVTASGRLEPLDASRTLALTRRIALHLDHASATAALSAISAKTGLRFTYDPALLPPDASVSLHADDITVAAALTQVLLDAAVDVEFEPAGLVAIRPRRVGTQTAQQRTGSISGRVVDAKTQVGIHFATIAVENTHFGATTGDSGQYRITGIPVGKYIVVARLIGYVATRQVITIDSTAPATADFMLQKSPNQLEQVVVTGTIIPTEVKAIPTPVTVITDTAIQNEHPRSMVQIFRETVPGAVAWDVPDQPDVTLLSVRGVANLSGESSLKVYIDGIEVADRDEAALDPTSVDHVEIIRGPEAATIYGSDAIGGVMQVFTKRGDSTTTRPQIDLETGFGAAQSPYAGYSGALRQEYQGSIHGGTPAASYNLGGGYTSLGNWVREAATSVPSGYGGVHFNQGLFALDLSARLYEQHEGDANNPALDQVWPSEYANPFYTHYYDSERTYGAHLAYTPLPQWEHQLTVGSDAYANDGHQNQPRLTTPADTALFLLYHNEERTSFAYNTSYHMHMTPGVGANITAGLDHYTLTSNQYLTFNALNTTGSIATEPGGTPQVSRAVVQNTGYFGQLQVNLADALFITTGLRAEQNSAFGASLGTPLLPRYGISYVHTFGATTIKFRSSYGQAIRPPDPGESQATAFGNNVQLANSLLGPERQDGWDAGFDLAATEIGTLSVSYYDQTADGLIQSVFVSGANQDLQFQNVGRVRNNGIEVDGSLTPTSKLTLRGQYAYTQSRVESLGANYTGDLRVGEQAFLVPYNTAGGSLTYTPLARTQITAGVSYVGGWRYYNFVTEFACYGGTGPCAASARDYLTLYHGFAKVNLSATQRLTRQLSAFLSIENLTDTEASEGFNTLATMGRMTMAGLRLHY